MARAAANGVTLEYDTIGSESGEPLLSVQGLGDQMIKWSDGFHQALSERGFYVIRFDNRDVGLSTHLDEAPVPDFADLLNSIGEGRVPDLPYRLEDMAADAVAVLDAAGIPRAHIAGASMGGMIAQIVAADYPKRILSLTSIMSSTGNPMLPPAGRDVIAALTSRTPDPSDEEAFLVHAVRVARMLGSPGYPDDEKVLRANLLAAVKRNYDPAGFGRQLAAIAANGDRCEKLKRITAPALVIHGTDDLLVPFAAGEDTAASIAGAELLAIRGMGHSLPHALYRPIAEAIAGLAARARAGASPVSS
jgi:pimeloyl-ACP methyl ester carboxylesterase